MRAQLDHPVIDADGHVIELLPAALDYIRESMTAGAFDRYLSSGHPGAGTLRGRPTLAERRATRQPQSAWWASPAANTLDLATAALPALLVERLGELGIDYAVLYPSRALGSARPDDAEVRRGLCRGINEYYAATYLPHSASLTVAGMIPMHDPDEALDELDHCHSLGLKVVAIPEGVWRPIKDRSDRTDWQTPGQTHWFDNFGLDTECEYDAVWERMIELGYPLISHAGIGQVAPNQYLSISNYSANHMGVFRDRMYQLCKSLFMSGLPRRFPELKMAFLECGIGWAQTLLGDLHEHWEKRNVDSLTELDPDRIDWELVERLVQSHGFPALDALDDLSGALRTLPAVGVPPELTDDWRHLQVEDVHELERLFTESMFFGCEADDRSVVMASLYNKTFDTRLRPIFSSDIGHWDVSDMSGVLAESYEPVERGILDPASYRAFMCDNAIELLTSTRPDFFVGTSIEPHVPGSLSSV